MYILAFSTILVTGILFLLCNKKVDLTKSFHDEAVSEVVKKIGDNEKLANELLRYIGNTKTKVEKNQDDKIKTSFYNCNTDKIIIKDTKDLEDCSRIIHIAHECIHSIQEKKLLKFHFILSNIQILYFLGIFIYFFYNRNVEIRLNLLLVQVAIFIATFFIKVVLESDATYRAPIIAFEYLSDKIKSDELKNFKRMIESELYPLVPVSFFSLYMQGAWLLIIAQVSAILV